jgi:purine catabolism regulator
MPTVEEVWNEALPSGTALVAGEEGLYAEVTWVVTLKSAPPAFGTLKGGELVLVGPRPDTKIGVPISRLVSSLGEKGASAICILGQVSTEARDRAATLGLALLELPPQTQLPALEARVSRLIADREVRLYQRELQLSRPLMELALADKGLSTILKKLEALTGRQAALLGRDFELLSPLAEDKAACLVRAQPLALRRLGCFSATAAAPPIVGLKLTPELICFLGPVLVGSETDGYLALMGSQLGEMDRIAVRAGALALAIEMARQRAAKKAEKGLQWEVVEALLTGDFPSPKNVAERARRVGLDLSVPYVAMSLRVNGSPYRGEALAKESLSVLGQAYCHCRGDGIVVLYPLAAGTDLRALVRDVARKLSVRLPATVSVGVGRSYPGPEGICLSFQESERALALGERLFGQGSATFFSDLGLHRLLFSVTSRGELEAFWQEYLGRLAEHDKKRGGTLMATLETWLHHGNVARTARALGVHRNTLLYRLERIRDITGLDLEDGATRLNLFVALRAREALRAWSQE